MKSTVSALALPVAILLSGSLAHANVNVFGYNNITVDPTYTSAVIAPFTAPCALYHLNCTGTKTFPDGFPLKNLFGDHEKTAEGVYDTIFADNGSSPLGYDNVFFHTNGTVGSGNTHLVVTGAQDGPSNGARSFTYFDLISYTFNPAAPLDPSYYQYNLLYHGTPTTNANGFETIDTHINLSNAGPNFVYQFGTDTKYPNSGARVFDVSATAHVASVTPEPGFYGLMSVGMAGLLVLARRKARG